MYKLTWTPVARKQYDALKTAAEKALAGRKKSGRTRSSKQEGRFKQVHKSLRLLSDNPKHPGLQTHPYDSLDHPFDKKAKVFVAYAQSKTAAAYRIFWCYGPARNEIEIIAITPHP